MEKGKPARYLRGYGYQGGYGTVKLATLPYRRKRREAFHELVFLPGEEAQVDWMEWKAGPAPVYGFIYVLAWSRYAVVRFYPRQTQEFFLDGHIRAFHEVGGIAHRHRYNNLKSVVLRRSPQIQFNPVFLDITRHYGFSIHACNVGRVNEKGRVERLIRGISRETLLSAVREANKIRVYKIKYIHGLLASPADRELPTVRPQDERLLEIAYEARRLDDYDDLI